VPASSGVTLLASSPDVIDASSPLSTDASS
jgi:hypothetical protein